MTPSNLPERKPDESWEPDRNPPQSGNDPERLTRGAWLSLAMSFVFFLTMVAIGVKFGVARHSGDEPAEAARTAFANPVANVPVPEAEIASASNTPAEDADTLLARAHECANAAQWDCVIDATSGVIAQRGSTPETKALLRQAMIHGGWVAGNPPASAINGNRHNVREVSTMPGEPKRFVRHWHRHTAHATNLRYTAASRPTSTDELADIYRH